MATDDPDGTASATSFVTLGAIMTSKIWFITGVSTGLGKTLADAALSSGDIVVGTLRKPDEVAAFDQVVVVKSHGVLLDVTIPNSTQLYPIPTSPVGHMYR